MIYNCIVVLISQIVFLWLRTVNVKRVALNQLWPAIFSGTGVGITWLISVSMGVDSLLDIKNKWPVTLCHLIGGAIGTYMGMRKKTNFQIK